MIVQSKVVTYSLYLEKIDQYHASAVLHPEAS
jgi:hypothetical protein